MKIFHIFSLVTVAIVVIFFGQLEAKSNKSSAAGNGKFLNNWELGIRAAVILCTIAYFEKMRLAQLQLVRKIKKIYLKIMIM
jgi:hypothetical protein